MNHVLRRGLPLCAAAILAVSLAGCASDGAKLSSTGSNAPEVIAGASLPGEPLTQAEVDHYLAKIEQNLTEERTGRAPEPSSFERIRAFAEADDGKAFYMINLVREHDAVTYPDWWTGQRAETVLKAKMLYSAACGPTMAEAGSYSTLGVMTAHDAVVTDDDSLEPWDQFYLIAYPNREAFIKLLASDPYADAIVHKYAGDKDTQLIPVSYAQIASPYAQA